MPKNRPTSYRWLWYFIAMCVLVASGIAANVWFNLSQQLTLEQLEANRQLWNDKGPRDYRLKYTIKEEVNPDPARMAPQRYTVEVLDGRITAVFGPDNKMLDPHDLEPGDFEFDSMDSLFAVIEKQLRIDADPARPRAFVKATFSARDGHIMHYVHSVMRTRKRLEVSVEMTPETGKAN